MLQAGLYRSGRGDYALDVPGDFSSVCRLTFAASDVVEFVSFNDTGQWALHLIGQRGIPPPPAPGALFTAMNV
jgi:hypothetical protein